MTVETGAIVAGANTYVTPAEIAARSDELGMALLVDEEILAAQSAEYLESFGPRFKGERVTRDQPMSWPRKNAVIEGWEWKETEIPRTVISAQLAIAMAINSGEDPRNPTPVELPVVSEKIEGALEIKRANPNQPMKISKASAYTTLINALLRNNGMVVATRS